MPLIRKHLLGVLLVVAACPTTSYALSCKSDPDERNEFWDLLGTALAVPADAPDGTIIWESEQRSLPVVCSDDYHTGKRETVYFYLNPANVSVGQGIRVGIRYGSQMITQASGSVSTGYDSYYRCGWLGNDDCNIFYKARFILNFKVFIEKYGKTPANGQASTANAYQVFQLDGQGGLTPKPEGNLKYIISGMNKIRFVPCSPELTITPSVVNFQRALTSSAKVGQVASSANFSLDLIRNCDTPYAVDARFTPIAGTASVIDKLLVPNQNTSVGIALTRQDNNQQVPFGNWFKLTDLTTPGLIRNEFRADLVWRGPAIPGAFEASALVDLSFK
ncbi:fimbrial protein [Pseudomonas putida]|uniref:Fimbrial protein n=1 Tax=Pseudomonas putida TaxID=303 RepID=A0AAW5HQP9_PSEPU|nr:fimbrial protein [Pseudomonas putida]MCO1624126.1 fimbrial protein [Pseudomonas putida]